MSVSDWERKRTLDRMFAHATPQQRAAFEQQVREEQDKMDKEKAKKKVSVAAPKNPFMKEDKTATGTSKPAGKSSKGDKKSPPKPDASRTDEVTTGQLGMVTPRPMRVDTLPGTEVRDDLAYSEITSPGTDNGHTHTAYYDEAGNGYTSMDDGHAHDVRSFHVSDYQTPHGGAMHSHPGVLTNPQRTPGSETKPYDGVMR